MEYDYKIHKLTIRSGRFGNRKTSRSILETQATDELLQSIERCLIAADRLDLKIVGLKLNEAYEALKTGRIN